MTTEDRLRRLEASQRRYRIAVGGGFLLLLCGLSMGAVDDEYGSHDVGDEYGSFELEGEYGMEGEAGGMMEFGGSSPADVKARKRNRRSRHQPTDRVVARSLHIVDNNGRTVIKLRVNDRGDGVVEVYNNRGTLVSLVGANFRGDGLINAANNDGDWVAAMAASDRGDGIIETFHARGTIATTIGCNPRGDGTINTHPADKRSLKMRRGGPSDEYEQSSD